MTHPAGPEARARGTNEARVPLSRERIVLEALRVVDEEGLQALSMRRLGSELGVEAMSLYRYVSGREDLLEALVSHLTDGLRRTAQTPVSAEDGWQAYIQWLAHEVRAVAHDHPQLFPLVATRHPAAPWLRPPLRSLEVVEDFLSVLTDQGFGDEAAAATYRAFTSFLVGHLLLEASQMGAPMVPDEPLDEGDERSTSALALDDFPTIQRLEPFLSEDRSDEEFEISLEELIDRIERQLR
ncbi:TetR family transcriptional regulator [Georgenia soli]|uniref:TetR family transcriptional regulator n=1 Tax=Georgenia soli TaxID=638953 RepID=A0A2A9EPQ8_9MICO|nr:TetR/AcrR family transcriptional regulator C-terminal domain-containing protein [Georgenia soli]PFG40189.1 TetR family transcriptional regulator [Georgenia soli]